MSELTNEAWKMLREAASQARTKYKEITFNEERKEDFEQLFDEKYDFVKSTFMKKSVAHLDRHKVASIIIACAIEVDIVIYEGEIPEGQVFLGKYYVATSAGMSYMQNKLNKILAAKKQKKIDRLWFPPAFSCRTPYFQIFARNLYFTDKLTDWKFNLLDMSEILFLLEYMTLEKNNIDPSILIEAEDGE